MAFDTNQNSWYPTNPTAVATWEDEGAAVLTAGLVEEDDILRAHGVMFCQSGVLGMEDTKLGIASGQSSYSGMELLPCAGRRLLGLHQHGSA